MCCVLLVVENVVIELLAVVIIIVVWEGPPGWSVGLSYSDISGCMYIMWSTEAAEFAYWSVLNGLFLVCVLLFAVWVVVD